MINHNILQDFSDFMGIDPLYFNNLDITGCSIESNDLCKVYWEYYRSRSYPSKIALDSAIATARLRIANFIRHWPTDEWIVDEEIEIPYFYDKLNPRMLPINKIQFQTAYGIKKAGKKETIKIATVALSYIDEDEDGFKERANFSFTLPDGVSLNDIKTAYTGTDTIVGRLNLSLDGETVSGWVYSYELVKPEIYLKRLFSAPVAYAACDEIYVDTLDVIYERPDTCLAHAEIIIEKNCASGCDYESVPACVKIVDNCEGYFTVMPGEYVDGCFLENTNYCALSGKPIKIKISYLTGPSENLRHLLEAPLFKLAASLMVPAHCTCDCYEFAIAMWQQDVSVKGKDGIEWRYPTNMRSNSIWGQTVGAIEAQVFLEGLIDIC